MLNDDIQNSWEKNAEKWIKTIDEELISSRKFTNPAIIHMILKSSPTTLLDVGCGEGWLTRIMTEEGIRATGIDASNLLVKNAKKKGKGNYFRMSYEEIINGQAIENGRFSTIAFNFSLFLKDDTEALLKKIKEHLQANGNIFIQTVHPFFLVTQNLPYKSQWMNNSWEGLKGDFTHSYKWYLRTLEDWIQLFHNCNLKIESIKEPVNEKELPVSVIFCLIKE